MWRVVSEIPGSLYSLLFTRVGVRKLCTSFQVRHPLSPNRLILQTQADHVILEAFPHLNHSVKDVAYCLNGLNWLIAYSCLMLHMYKASRNPLPDLHGASTGQVVMCLSVGVYVIFVIAGGLCESLIMNCYMAIVKLLQDERDGLIQQYLSEYEETCSERFEDGESDASNDDDGSNASYACWEQYEDLNSDASDGEDDSDARSSSAAAELEPKRN